MHLLHTVRFGQLILSHPGHGHEPSGCPATRAFCEAFRLATGAAGPLCSAAGVPPPLVNAAAAAAGPAAPYAGALGGGMAAAA